MTKKKSNQESFFSEDLYKTLFEQSPSALVLIDREAKVLLVNQKFCTLVGYDKEEVLGSDWTKHLPKTEVAKLLEKHRQRGEGQTEVPNEYEVDFYHANQKLRSALLSVTQLHEKGLTLIAVTDNTERKKEQVVLEESEYFFRESQRAAEIGSYRANFKEGFFTSSQTMDEIFGLTREDEKTIDPGWVHLIYEEDRQGMLEYLKTEILEKKKKFDREYRIIRKNDKKLRWVHGKGSLLLDEEGKPHFLIGTIQDITERKKYVERLADHKRKLDFAMKLTRLGVWECNVRKQEFLFNDPFYAIFKTSVEEVGSYRMSIGEYASRFVFPEDQGIVASEVEKAILTKDPFFTNQIEHRIVYPGGEVGYIAVRFGIVKNLKGETIKLFGINQDITEIRVAQKELRENEARLKELNSMKDQFFSIVSHDLRGPFSAIVALSELLVESVANEELENLNQYGSMIHRSSEKALGLLTNLMEWSKCETGRSQFMPQFLNPFLMVNEVVGLLAPLALRKKIELQNEVSKKLMMDADASMLNTVFRNLISNAIKFTFSGGVVRVKAALVENEVLFSVEDNGRGMPEKIKEKLFRIGEKVTLRGTEKEEGTGLGLILCKEFVAIHGGSIWVESEEGKGSTFYFRLPVKR